MGPKKSACRNRLFSPLYLIQAVHNKKKRQHFNDNELTAWVYNIFAMHYQ